MLIKKIRLKNFKNFKDAELELGDMNVLVGANASGKSNFLQALKFLKDIQEHGLENAISLQGGMEYLRNVNCGEDEAVEIEVEFNNAQMDKILATVGSVSSELYLDNTNLVYLYKQISGEIYEEVTIKSFLSSDEPSNSVFFDGMKISQESEFYYSFENKLFNKNGIIEYDTITDTFDSLEFSYGVKETEKFILKYGYDIFPFNDRNYAFGLGKRIGKNQSLLELDLISESIFNYSLFDFDLKKIKQPNSIIGKVDLEPDGHNLSLVIKKILSDEKKARQFSNLISDILPFIKSIETEKFYDKSLLFKIQEKGHTSPIPSSLLSDGTVSVTAILIALFFENNRLTIIEEPEYGIHPSLVSKLVDTFYEAAKNKQIIITTHSSEILKHIKLEDLRLISRDENGFSTISKPAEKEMVKAFLKNELGINDLFVQNLLDI